MVVDRQLGLPPDVRLGADVAQEGQRLAVAAHQHVLTVVDEFARLAIGERRGTSTQPGARFEHEHASAVRAPAAPRRSSPANPLPTTITS